MSDDEMLRSVDDEDFAERVESLLGKLEDKGAGWGRSKPLSGRAEARSS